MNVTIINPTTLQLSWSPGETQQIVNTWGLKVNYQANDNKTHSILVDKHHEEANISQLRPNTTYTIWAVPVTPKGFGFSSQVLNVTTPYRGNFYYQYYLEKKGDFRRSVRGYWNTLIPSIKWIPNGEFTISFTPNLELPRSFVRLSHVFLLLPAFYRPSLRA